MIGYHHVLMIVIAVAIILLCKFEILQMNSTFVSGMFLTMRSSPVGRMLFIVSTNPRYLLDLDVL